MRLLLVEDEPFIAMDLENLATSAGHQVVGVAECLSTAAGLAAAEHPQAALVDLNLRDGLTGPQIARLLTGQHGMKVAFVTGNAEQLKSDFAGALGVLEKPFSDYGVLELLKLLEAALCGTVGAPPRFVTLAAAGPGPA